MTSGSIHVHGEMTRGDADFGSVFLQTVLMSENRQGSEVVTYLENSRLCKREIDCRERFSRISSFRLSTSGAEGVSSVSMNACCKEEQRAKLGGVDVVRSRLGEPGVRVEVVEGFALFLIDLLRIPHDFRWRLTLLKDTLH